MTEKFWWEDAEKNFLGPAIKKGDRIQYAQREIIITTKEVHYQYGHKRGKESGLLYDPKCQICNPK